jgi:hypothetical protein
MDLLEVAHLVLLWVLGDALKAHQLVASEAVFLIIRVRMLPADERTHATGIVLQQKAVMVDLPRGWLFVRRNKL